MSLKTRTWKNLSSIGFQVFFACKGNSIKIFSSGHQKKKFFDMHQTILPQKTDGFSLQKKSTSKQPNPQSITCERLEIKAMIGMKANAETMHEASNRTLCAGIYSSCLWSPVYHFCRHEFVEEVVNWQYTILAICGKVFLNDGIPEQIIPRWRQSSARMCCFKK